MSCWGFTDFLITALAVLFFLCFAVKKSSTQAPRMDLLNKEKSERLRTLRPPDCINKVSVITTCFCSNVQRCRSTSLAIMDSFHPLKRTHPLTSCRFMSISSCCRVIRSERLFVFAQRLTLTHHPSCLAERRDCGRSGKRMHRLIREWKPWGGGGSAVFMLFMASPHYQGASSRAGDRAELSLIPLTGVCLF